MHTTESFAGATAPALSAALLQLADGRFPAGGYAHSGGLEATIAAGGVYDLATLEAFLRGRAATAGAVAAAFAAAACTAFADDLPRLHALDAELDARLPSAALRATSRQLGRQMLRAITVIRPHPRLAEIDKHPHQPVMFGIAAAALDLHPRDAALAALHDSVATPAAAAVRLLSLDPLRSYAALARLGPMLDKLTVEADERAGAAPEALPALAAPLLDIAAERHAVETARLFAS
jgi:urease accessory protein